MTILLCCYFGIFISNAEDTHVLLNGNSTGYMNSSSSADPRTEAMTNWGYIGPVAFPYAYRCIGVHRTGSDAALIVNRLILHLTKLQTGSSETGSEIPGSLQIYTSSDNAAYTLVDNTTYVTTCNTLSDGSLEIMLDGLGITQPYIKICSARTLSWYVFGKNPFSQIMSLYTLNSALFGNSQSLFTSAATGYINSSSSSDPLTEVMSNFGVIANMAFPYSYRCIGINKGDNTQEVSRILIDLDKLITSSTETGAEIIDDMELYVSSDNIIYRRVPDSYTKYMGRVPNGIKIVLDGLCISEQYIKLRCPRTLGGYVFGKLPLPQMVKLVHATDRKQIFSMVGYEESYPSNDPLAGTISMFGYYSSVAFPYLKRSIGIKKDDSETGFNVQQIVLNLEKLVTSSETGLEIVEDMNVYISDDNATYTLLPKTYSIYVTTVTNPDGLKIVLDGLDISQKYIKVYCPRETGYVFGQSNLQSIMTAFHYTPSRITAIDLPRFTHASTAFKVSASAKQNETLKISYVPTTENQQNLWTLTLTSDGTATHSGTVNLQNLPAGKIKLYFELFGTNNSLIDRKDAYVFNTSGFVSNGLVADNVSVIAPDVCTWNGGWNTINTTICIDRTLSYKQAANSDATCTAVLPNAGWCALYVGLVGRDSHAVVSGLGTSPQTVNLEDWRSDQPIAASAVGDAFVGCYNLTGQTITISRYSETTPLKISHVVVRKLSPADINIATASSSIAPRIITHSDGYSGFFIGAYTAAGIQNVVEGFNNVPIYAYDWELGTTTVFNINTRYGVSFGANGIDPSHYYRAGDRTAGEFVQNLLTNNINPLSLVCNIGNQQGTTTNVAIRMGAFYSSPYSDSHNGPILNDSNAYRQRNIDGTTYALRLSYAYPEVRNYVINALEDALDSSVDGVHLQFLRDPPFFGYDQPVIDEYSTRYEVFTPDCYMNANWQQIQRDIMTGFVADIYNMMQTKRPGIKLKVSFDQQNYYRQGLDVSAWVANGWVDVISPGYYNAPAQGFDLSPFTTMINGTSCKIFVHTEATIVGKDPTPEEENGEITIIRVNMSLNQFKKYFMDMHVQGADGLYPFNYGDSNSKELARAVEDMKDNNIWLAFQEPFIDWFDYINE